MSALMGSQHMKGPQANMFISLYHISGFGKKGYDQAQKIGFFK